MGRSRDAVVLLELPPDHVLLADQDDFNAQIPGGSNRPFDFGCGGVVAAHCIYGNGQHVRQGLLLLDFDDFAALVLAAVRADAVGELGLVAVRALREARTPSGHRARGGWRSAWRSVYVSDSAFLKNLTIS